MNAVERVFLLVDDDERLRERLARALRDRGITVFTAADAESALVLAEEHQPDGALLDLRLGSDSGLALIPRLLALDPTLRVVMLTGYGSIATAVDAVRLGAVNYLTKPVDADMVLAAFAKGEADPLTAVPTYEAPTLARTEWEHISRVLEDHGGNVSRAAKALGMHRRTLQRKLATFPPRR